MLLLLLACAPTGAPDQPPPTDLSGDHDAPAGDSAPARDSRRGDTAHDTDAGRDSRDDAHDTATSPVQITDLSASKPGEPGSLLVVSWRQSAPADARVEYHLDGEDWRATPTAHRAAGPAEALLLGLPYDSPVTWRVVLYGPALQSAEQSAATAPAPANLPQPSLLHADPAGYDADAPWWFLSVTESPGGYDALSAGWWTLILDRQARVVWARRTPDGAASLHPRVALTGDSLLVDQNSFWGALDGGAASQILRLTIDGAVVETYDTPGLHHPFTDTPDGALLWPAREGRGEVIYEHDAGGAHRALFDCQAWLAGFTFRDTCGSNSLSYDPASGRLLYSLFSPFAVVELDRGGAPLRHFGALAGGVPAAFLGQGFWWQHGAHYTDAGTLLLSSYATPAGGESAIREYAVAGDVLELVWSYRAGAGTWGQFMGEPHRLAGGNTLHNLGSLPRLREVTPDGEIVWEVAWEGARWIGRSTPIPDLYALAP